ncbi:MAG TPA: serine acetyltransferase [Buttiauxella sp.]|nr:serine acetyltransferase [Buttiauxella sp.]
MNTKTFSWFSITHKAFKCPERRFNFWWRIASYLYKSGGAFRMQIARKINRKLIQKYNTEIQLSAVIGPGLVVTHYLSVVINGCAIIGSNFKIRQNTTIGLGGNSKKEVTKPKIIIGDNVEIGANTCIIGNALTIGNNVTIGAMSFINKNIPDNAVAYSEKSLKLRIK